MKKRVISAVVALAIIIPLIALGGIYFKIGMAVLSILSMYEILKLRKELPIFIKVISYVLITLSVIFSDVSLLPIILITMSVLLVFFDKSEYNKINHQLLLFGRYYCKAKNPLCQNCKMECKYKKTRKI